MRRVELHNIERKMNNLDLSALGADVNITLRVSDLRKAADELLTSAIERVRTELSIHPKDAYYTIKQVAELLSVDRTTLFRWQKGGYLIPIKVGGLVRYRKSDVEELINRG